MHQDDLYRAKNSSCLCPYCGVRQPVVDIQEHMGSHGGGIRVDSIRVRSVPTSSHLRHKRVPVVNRGVHHGPRS